MPRRPQFTIGAIVTHGFVPGAIAPADFVAALQSAWTGITAHAITDERRFPFVLAWSVKQPWLRGRLADAFYRLDIAALPVDAATFGCWYRRLVPMSIQLAFVAADAVGQHSLTITHTTATHDILAYIETCRTVPPVPTSDPSQAAYQLRITRTNRRRQNQRLFLVERLEQNAVVLQSLETRQDLRIRLLAERGVLVHTNIREFAELCAHVGTVVMPLPSDG